MSALSFSCQSRALTLLERMFNFPDYIAERTQDFIGREWVFAEIDAWLATPDAPRYFIITGELGIGKTALAGRLTQMRFWRLVE